MMTPEQRYLFDVTGYLDLETERPIALLSRLTLQTPGQR